MLFLSNIEGTITAVVPSPLYQNSQNANEIVLIAPFPDTAMISVAFILPNGQYVRPYLTENDDAEEYHLMALLPEFSPALYDGKGNGYNAWRMVMDYALTQQSGDLTVQFTVIESFTVNNKPMIKRIPTSAVSFTINKGVPYIPPDTPSVGAWEEITTAISSLRASLNDEITALETDVGNLASSVANAQENINSLNETAVNLQDGIDDNAEDITEIGGRVTALETDVETLGDRVDGIYSASGFFKWDSDYTVETYEELEEGDFIPQDDNGDYIYDGQLYRVRSSGKYIDDVGETELDFPANALFAFDTVTARWYPIGGDDTPIDTSELVTKEEFDSTIGDLSTILEMLNNGGIT